MNTSEKALKPALPQALQRDITGDYNFGRTLGKGHFGVVRLATHKNS
jgi:serine/threonine protein kinase